MNVDRTGRKAVGSRDNSRTSALRGPVRLGDQMPGPLSYAAAMETTEIVCQAPHPSRPTNCGRRLALVPGRAEPVGLASDLSTIPVGHAGGWCPNCKQASVYRMLGQEAA